MTRIAIGWRKFWALKPMLMNRKVSRKKRLRLFDATVGSSVLYGSHAWTPRTDEVAEIRTAQNRMLRRICCLARGPDESWLDWIRRTTHSSRQLANQAGVRDWVSAHAKKKWLWAGHVSRRPASTWLWRVSSWRDAEWSTMCREDGGPRLLRPSRRRWMKWEDSLRRFSSSHLGNNWMSLSADRTAWSAEADAFARWFSKADAVTS